MSVSPFLKDWLERVLWTLAQAVVSVVVVSVGDLPYWWVAVLTPVLSGVKGFVAKKANGTAALVPSKKPAAPAPAAPTGN